MKSLLIVCLLIGSAAAEPLTIRGVPNKGKPFTIPMRDDDSIGSVYQCMDMVHRRAHWYSFHHRTGRCLIPAGSLRPGKHSELTLKYPGVTVGILKP